MIQDGERGNKGRERKKTLKERERGGGKTMKERTREEKRRERAGRQDQTGQKIGEKEKDMMREEIKEDRRRKTR